MGENIKSSIRTVNPTTGIEEKVFEPMSTSQVDQILENADKAFKSWKKTSIADGAKIINKVAEIMQQRKEELSKLATTEMGKLLVESRVEVDICVQIFQYYADNAAEFLADKPLKTPLESAFISYEPLGTILSIQPWNFPYYQITRSAAPNLMAGNTMVMKHASNVPQCAKIMEDIFTEAGLPSGVYTNIFLPGSQTDALISDKRIKAVAFTGSEPAGSIVASAAGRNIKKSTLELGGSDAFVVLDDADLDQAVNTAYFGRLWNAGQVCISPKRIIVAESILPQFTEKLLELVKQTKIGDPMNPETQLAPLSSEKAREGVLKQVKEAIQQGATLLHGGNAIDGPGAFMEPTVLTNIKKGNSAYSEEIFGPVFCLYGVKSDEEAVELANDSDFGLGGSVFSQNVARAQNVARQIETGMVYINHLTGIAAELPFGGTKGSGYGREQSPAGIYEFVNEKLIRTTKPENPY